MLERSTALFRKSTWLTVSSLPVFIGAGAALALNARGIALALAIVGALCVITGFCLAAAAYSSSKRDQAVLVRDALADQQRRMGGTTPGTRE